jgi:hypothetical protein
MRDMLNKQPQPPTEWVWVSKAIVDEVARLVRESTDPVVVWTRTTAVGSEVARALELPWYGAGKEAAAEIRKERGTRSVVASAQAHGTGLDGLQFHFKESLVVGWAPNGSKNEQMLGRIHRPGQESAVVRYRLFDAFETELKSSIRDARYIQALQGTSQKLLTSRMTRDLNKEIGA